MTEILGGQLVVETIKKHGGEYIFGMPGFQLMSMYDAIYKTKPGLRHILVHDEKCAAFMAFGYARMKEKPGLCDATVGPGATNLVSGIAEAFYSSTPIIAITSDVRMEFVGKSPNQECDQLSVIKPLVKKSYNVNLPERIVELTSKSLYDAASGRPGPVHLNLPENINYAPISFDWKSEIEKLEPVKYPLTRIRADAASVDKTAELLESAEHPVCIAGGGVHISKANAKLLLLVEKLNMPVATSLTGKGSIPETHPLALSICGRFDRYANHFIKNADLIFVVGSKLGELVTSRWSIIPRNVPLIQCDIDPAEINRNYKSAVGVVADARTFLDDVLECLGSKKLSDAKNSQVVNAIEEFRKNWMKSVMHLTHDDEMPTNPARILREIRRFLSKDSLLVVDGGLATHWAGLYYDVYRAAREFLPNRGQAAIGCGFPAAIGAQLALPDSTVVAFIGDGGFCQGIAELETAVREKIPVIVCVLNNECLGYVKALQHAVFDRRYQSADYSKIKFDKVAQGMGCRGIKIRKIEQLVPELEKARDSGQVTVLEIPTTKDPAKMLPKEDKRAARC